MGLALPAQPPAIVAPAPEGTQGAKPFVLAQIEPPGPVRVEPPPTLPGQKPEQKPEAVRKLPFLKPELDIDMIRTRDLDLLYFAPTETYLTPYVGRSLENALAFQKRFYDWKPWERPTVLLKDFADYGNASARVTPNNALFIEVSPLRQVYETLSAGERFFFLANHETTHLVTMDGWNQTDATWRRIFHGKPLPIPDHPETILYDYLAAPRVTAPRWYPEGSAVFMETWMGGGYGRAEGAYDEMVFRAMVRDNAHFDTPLQLEAEGDKVDFQVGVNDYLYGTRFMSYLAETRSPEKLIQWYRRDPGSKAFYAAQFKHVFGEPLDKVWNEWIAWEHDFQRANLASVQAYPTTKTQRLTPMALGSVSRTYYDPASNSLLGGFRYPGVIAHMGELSLSNGKMRHLADIDGPILYRVTSVAFDPASRTAWFTSDNSDTRRDLIELDVKTGHTKTLLTHERIGDMVFDPADRSLWGLRHDDGLVTLVRIPPPYTAWNQIHTFKYGEVPFDLDISPDGQLLSASVGEINGDQSVRVWRVADLGPDEPVSVAELRLGQATPEGFVFSPDGRYLYGSAYYTGVSNIYRFEVATQKVEAVSNAVTGLFRPIPRPDGSLIAFEYTGQGFAPVRFDPKPLSDLGSIQFLGAKVAEDHPIVKTWTVGSPAKAPFDSMVISRGKYDPLHELHWDSSYPMLEGYKHHMAVGWTALFEDPLQFDQITVTLAYSPAGDLPARERFHAEIDVHNLKWSFKYWHNLADFYDLFGPVDRSLRGDAFIVDYKNPVIYDPPKQMTVSAEIAGYVGLDTIPGAQNIKAGDIHNVAEGKLGFTYEDTDKSLGALDYEKGMRAEGQVIGDYANGQDFPKFWAGIDFGRPLPIKHASLWLYTAVGDAWGDGANPLTPFYMGSFRNNYVDFREVKRYREYDSFPGFGIDAIAARRFAKGLLELNLPPFWFGGVGVSNLYLSSARTALFAGAMLVEPPTGGPTRTLKTLGGQVDFNFTVALRLPMVLSVGYAAGLESGQKTGNEAMISLKIL
ncbi:MAG TPA: hypothetical protein VGN38_02645 [Caulobacteraceae bacterium]|jgi:hypothetical protein|nr:hypothetical protein [Caulobacteraceae bacterium]